MREGTSGFWLSQTENELQIGYEDYGVGMFGGGDYEKTYIMDAANAKKFETALRKKYSGTLEAMVEEAFTRNFNDRAFATFCKKHRVQYETSSWIS